MTPMNDFSAVNENAHCNAILYCLPLSLCVHFVCVVIPIQCVCSRRVGVFFRWFRYFSCDICFFSTLYIINKTLLRFFLFVWNANHMHTHTHTCTFEEIFYLIVWYSSSRSLFLFFSDKYICMYNFLCLNFVSQNILL